MIRNETLLELSKKQTILDQRILSDLNIDVVLDKVYIKKIIAFFVELGEFINEERSFKYWSRRKENDRNKVIEEYIDGIHFILSLGLEIKYDFLNHKNSSVDFANKDLYDVYLIIVCNLSNFIKTKSQSDYEFFLNSYLKVAEILNYSEDEIINVYNKKNEKNHIRQDNNY